MSKRTRARILAATGLTLGTICALGTIAAALNGEYARAAVIAQGSAWGFAAYALAPLTDLTDDET